MGRPRKAVDEESISAEEPGKRLYVSNLGSVNHQAMLVEQFFRDDKTTAATLKALVLKGLEVSYDERTRLVSIYALIHDLNYEQAWLRIVTNRAERLDFSKLTDEQFRLLDEQLAKNTVYQLNKKT